MPEIKLNTKFIEQQRVRLKALHQQLLGEDARITADGRAPRKNRGDELQDPGEQSIAQAQDEVDQGVHAVDKHRLSNIQRALQKIAEGTYGLSDISGEPIPEARLKAIPEAIVTVQEEELREIQNKNRYERAI